MTPVPVPDHYVGPAAARDILLGAVLISLLLVVLGLLVWCAVSVLREGHRNLQALLADDTVELPAVEDIPEVCGCGRHDLSGHPLRGGVYVPPDPIAEHADDWAGLNQPTHRYPCVTDANWPATDLRVDSWRWN